MEKDGEVLDGVCGWGRLLLAGSGAGPSVQAARWLRVLCSLIWPLILLPRSVGSVLFYALGLSLLLVGLHGVFHVPDDLFLDEPQVGIGGTWGPGPGSRDAGGDIRDG